MTREEWLKAACAALQARVFARISRDVPDVWVSTGFPKGPRGGGRRAIGQCWNGALSVDGAPHVFISPELDDPDAVLATLAHELVHAIVGTEEKHRGEFIAVSRAIGLQRPWTATTPNEELALLLAELSEELGPYPHSRLDPGTVKKQAARNVLWKCRCADPPKVRAAVGAQLKVTCDVCGAPLAPGS